MLARLLLAFIAAVAALLPAAAHAAAASAQLLTPQSVSVLGNTSRVFSVRFFDALGQPAVGEPVTFMNDACGFFPNGNAVITVATDATGTASTTFTARAQGITCWLIASAGVQARFDVLTFVQGQVHFATTIHPQQPLPGEAFDLRVTPMAGAYPLHEVEIEAAIVPGTGSAWITPSSAGSGQGGGITFRVTPEGRAGDFEVELRYRNVVHRVPVIASTTPWQDMWWSGPAENGWGVSVVQHRDVLFSVIYAYDAAGKPTWYVMPGGTWDAGGTTYTGALYSPRGAPYSAYDAKDFVVGTPVGKASLRFVDGNNAVLTYAIQGVQGSKSLTRQLFGPVDPPLGTSHADMWWGGAEQNGWGIAFLQQYRTLFGVWFTYDAAGLPTWFVMPSGFWSSAGTWEGGIYRASGPPWLGVPYDVRAFSAARVGNFRVRFGAEAATFEYTIDGRSGTMPLMRQPF